MSDYELRAITTTDPLYADALTLRFKVLREPLGMSRDSLPTPDEHLGPHIVALDAGRVVGTVSLKPLRPEVGKLYQMAVEPGLQGSGVGRLLVQRLEREARALGLRRIDLHARETASGFYAKLGYVIEGERFLEVGVPHFVMTQTLR